jgi:hypothetical protein
MDTCPPRGHDDEVEPTYPSGSEPDPRAVPGVLPQTEGEGKATWFALDVDGENFALRPDDHGGTGYLREE